MVPARPLLRNGAPGGRNGAPKRAKRWISRAAIMFSMVFVVSCCVVEWRTLGGKIRPQVMNSRPINQMMHNSRPELRVKAGDMDSMTTIISQGVPTVIAGALAVNLFADPERRRTEMTQAAGGDEMASVKNYFNGEGFQRWRKIYGETDEVNKVQKDIRDGHAVTVQKVLDWLKLDGGVKDVSVCDAGCGTGSLTVPLAIKGAKVSASDIAVEMTNEARRRFERDSQGQSGAVEPTFEAKNLEEIDGKYDVVTCLDVMIHYPQDRADSMIKHLASRAEKRLIVSFAPKSFYYSTLKRIGELFPGPSKATRAYLHAEADVEKSLNEAGWKVVRREMTATNFYFSRLLEAVPA